MAENDCQEVEPEIELEPQPSLAELDQNVERKPQPSLDFDPAPEQIIQPELEAELEPQTPPLPREAIFENREFEFEQPEDVFLTDPLISSEVESELIYLCANLYLLIQVLSGPSSPAMEETGSKVKRVLELDTNELKLVPRNISGYKNSIAILTDFNYLFSICRYFLVLEESKPGKRDFEVYYGQAALTGIKSAHGKNLLEDDLIYCSGLGMTYGFNTKDHQDERELVKRLLAAGHIGNFTGNSV